MRIALFIVAMLALVFPAQAELPANVRVAAVKPAPVIVDREPAKPARHLVRQVHPECRFDGQLAHLQNVNTWANQAFAHDWDVDPSGGALVDSKFTLFHEEEGVLAQCLHRITFELEGETGWALVLHTYRQDYVLSATVYEDGTPQGMPNWSDWLYADFIIGVEDLRSGAIVPLR